ncbi:MAG TPA: DUF3300 domain-containing protein [Acetobacteraceae bacterium]|nr:DUF3300 domain-containing protein [Acetobacteraceae bacterium]
MSSLRIRLATSAAAVLLLLPAAATAQQIRAPSAAEAAAAIAPAPAPQYTRAQLDQMLAPIALYPDQVLMQVLMAATFPQQLIEAEGWLQSPQNAALKGDDLVRALAPLPWDPSVKSLVAFPQVIAMMTDHLGWTEALGFAFADQQNETMARVQFLRQRALAAGRLHSTAQLRIERQGPEVVIVPAQPNVVYLPVYDPAVVYGAWPDQGYPPVYIPPPPNFYSGAIGAGIGFSIGFGVVEPLWGWGHPDWRRHEVVIDQERFTRITRRPRDVAVRGHVWHRTAPMARVPEGAHRHRAARAEHRPAGTVAPSTVARRGPSRARPGPTPHQPGHAAEERGRTHPTGRAAEERGPTHPTGRAAEERGRTHQPGHATEERGQPRQPGHAAEEHGRTRQPGHAAEEHGRTHQPGRAAEGSSTPPSGAAPHAQGHGREDHGARHSPARAAGHPQPGHGAAQRRNAHPAPHAAARRPAPHPGHSAQHHQASHAAPHRRPSHAAAHAAPHRPASHPASHAAAHPSGGHAPGKGGGHDEKHH